MSALAADRICHVYRNATGYPSEANAMKVAEEIGDGTTADVEVCGLPLVRLRDTEYWYCVECDRPRQDWPIRQPTV